MCLILAMGPTSAPAIPRIISEMTNKLLTIIITKLKNKLFLTEII